jgi:hypothetical protein
MSVQTLEIKHVVPVAAVLRTVRSVKIPMWAAVALVVLSGLYGFVAGRQNPVHHYVPYVGYPLVMDTTTGKACYSSQPKPLQEGSTADMGYPADTAQYAATGPAIPLCGKE